MPETVTTVDRREIELLAGRLGLGEWQLTLSDEPPADDVLAEVVVPEHTRQATIHVSDTAAALPAAERRRVLAHELAHLLLWDLDGLARDTVERANPDAYPLFDVAFTQQLELAVERIADVVVADGCVGRDPRHGPTHGTPA